MINMTNKFGMHGFIVFLWRQTFLYHIISEFNNHMISHGKWARCDLPARCSAHFLPGSGGQSWVEPSTARDMSYVSANRSDCTRNISSHSLSSSRFGLLTACDQIRSVPGDLRPETNALDSCVIPNWYNYCHSASANCDQYGPLVWGHIYG